MLHVALTKIIEQTQIGQSQGLDGACGFVISMIPSARPRRLIPNLLIWGKLAVALQAGSFLARYLPTIFHGSTNVSTNSLRRQ